MIESSFKIKTSIGDHKQDRAIIFDNDKRVYFVVETKVSLEKIDLRGFEGMKIHCGKKHFAEFENVDFKAPACKLGEILLK